MTTALLRGRGYRGLIDIVSALRHRPRTVKRLHKALPEAPGLIPLSKKVRRLYDAGVLHISGWEPPARGIGQCTRIYAFGRGEDAPPPRRADGKPSRAAAKIVPVRRANARGRTVLERFVALWNALEDTPMSCEEAAAEAGLALRDVRKALHAMHDAQPRKLAHISEWRRGERAGPTTAMWMLGGFDDAPRPPAQTEQEYSRRALEKRKARLLHRRMSFFPTTRRTDAAQP
jgi:hypothetical protein